MKLTNRSIHRDFAYFYFGLIIAFSFSGIILNHRQDWYPMDYSYDSKEISITIPEEISKLDNKEYLENISDKWEIDKKIEGHRIRGEQLRIFFEDNVIADINIKNGKGLLEYKKRTPIIGDTMLLHKTTDKFWIWYSDIFGIAMLTIAFTGILIPAGKNGFKKRGWKLALLGIIFPLIFLFFLA